MLKNKLTITLIFIAFLIPQDSKAQSIGVSFSYFLPKDGYFSAPISPFSFRGLGFDVTNWFALETGITLYRMSGLKVKGVPFESKKPFVGPNFTFLVPVEGVIQIVGSSQEFKLRGGVFFFVGAGTKLNEGNIDRAIREYEAWDVANSNFDFENHPGWGTHFGAEYVVYFRDQFGISFGANYFIGDAKLNLAGSYTGFEPLQGLTTRNVEFQDSKIDFTGFEISLGLLFSNQ